MIQRVACETIEALGELEADEKLQIKPNRAWYHETLLSRKNGDYTWVEREAFYYGYNTKEGFIPHQLIELGELHYLREPISFEPKKFWRQRERMILAMQFGGPNVHERENIALGLGFHKGNLEALANKLSPQLWPWAEGEIVISDAWGDETMAPAVLLFNGNRMVSPKRHATRGIAHEIYSRVLSRLHYDEQVPLAGRAVHRYGDFREAEIIHPEIIRGIATY